MSSNASQVRLQSVVFILVIGLISLLLAAESVRIAWASRLGRSTKVADLKRAVSMDPGNPDLHFRLGMAEVFDLENADTAGGVEQLDLATRLSPHETRYWSALASACQFEGNSICAGKAISRTLSLSGMAPRIHWEAANYYLWANRQDEAFNQFRRLLDMAPRYSAASFRASLGSTGDPQMVYDALVTPAASPKLKLAYIAFTSSHGYGDFAFQIWKDLMATKPDISFSDADPYLETLIGAHKYEQALSVWSDLQARGLAPKSDGSSNLVFNGGFEHIPINAGFDWRYHDEPYTTVQLANRSPSSGKRCLRLDFSDVGNHQDEPVYQVIPVSPDQNYLLTAQVNSINIVSGSGPVLRVTDPVCWQCLTASTEAVMGTTPWHQIALRFRTGPRTSAVRVSIWRARSLGYPTAILGTLWLDQVSLKAETPAAAQLDRKTGPS
jgi:tetratricopeptide (TPR) repeat protein